MLYQDLIEEAEEAFSIILQAHGIQSIQKNSKLKLEIRREKCIVRVCIISGALVTKLVTPNKKIILKGYREPWNGRFI
jgi:hypothetical protein